MKKTIVKTTTFLLVLFWFGTIFAQNQLVGTVNYHDDPAFPMPEVSMHLLDMNNNLIQSTITNDYGEYAFDSIPDGSYYLSIGTTLDPGEVTLQDAFLIMMHLFGLYDFTDYEFAAADVNGSGTITWSDYFIVLINYLLQGQPFPVGEWQFEPVQLEFTSARTIGIADTANVWATGSGDVEGIWLPSGRSLALVTGLEGEHLQLNTETLSIPINSNYSELMSGFSITISYPADLVTINNVQGPDGNLNYAITENQISIIWMDESERAGAHFYGDLLCTLEVSARIGNTNQATGSFELEEQGMILDAQGIAVETEIRLPAIKIAASGVQTNTGVFPNPVRDNMEIRFEPTTDSNLEVHIINAVGQTVKIENYSSSTLYSQSAQLNVGQLKSGIYTYLVKSNNTDTVVASGRFYKSE